MEIYVLYSAGKLFMSASYSFSYVATLSRNPLLHFNFVNQMFLVFFFYVILFFFVLSAFF